MGEYSLFMTTGPQFVRVTGKKNSQTVYFHFLYSTNSVKSIWPSGSLISLESFEIKFVCTYQKETKQKFQQNGQAYCLLPLRAPIRPFSARTNVP